MLKVIVGTTLDTQPAKTVAAEETVQSVLEDYQATTGFDITKGKWTIGGEPLSADELSKTFGELGYDNKEIRLMNIVTAKNA